MNTIFRQDGPNFRKETVSSQYANIKGGFQGLEGMNAYASVWACSFSEAASIFSGLIREIEATAQNFEVTLEKRTTDDPSELRIARVRRSKQLSLFKKAKPVTLIDLTRHEPAVARASHVQVPQVITRQDFATHPSSSSSSTSLLRTQRRIWSNPITSSSNPGVLQSPVLNSKSSNVQTLTDQANRTAGLDVSAYIPKNTPYLLFRCWSNSSHGINSTQKIRASKFEHLSYPILGLPSEHELLWDASLHLSRQPQGTSLISTSPMLIWVIHKCCHLQDTEQNITVINGPSAQNHSGVFHGEPIISELRKRNMFDPAQIRSAFNTNKFNQICHYKGFTEYFVHGEVVSGSIITTVPFNALERLAASSPAVTRFLRLDILRKALTLGRARKRLAKERPRFDTEVAVAMAKIALLFGFSPKSDTKSTAFFLLSLFQDWNVAVPKNRQLVVQAFQSFMSAFTTFSGVMMDRAMEHKLEDVLKSALAMHSKMGTKIRPWDVINTA